MVAIWTGRVRPMEAMTGSTCPPGSIADPILCHHYCRMLGLRCRCPASSTFSKLSLREPIDTSVPNGRHPWHHQGQAPGILTDKPRPWRHRLGEGANGRRRLSRGRWALPAGSCYRVPGDPLPPWADWAESWFPREGYSFKQLGTALALPLQGPP